LPDSFERPLGLRYATFDELLAESDYVSVHLPSNASTQGLLDRRAFARMKRGAVLVNISRAPIIDRAALMEALETGRLGGAGLDVHYEEPSSPDEPLKRFPNVVLTPHTAVASRVNGAGDMEELAANLAAALA
jgi:phosphoglycerate dehydrogenase-like enzyme